MNSAQVIAAVAFLPATAYMAYRVLPVRALMKDDLPGRRTRRLVFRRMFLAVAVWELAIAAFLLTMGSWTVAPAVIVTSGAMLLFARRPDLLGL